MTTASFGPDHRVTAFCDWLDTIPPDPPFYTHPEFHRFSDLTDGEIMAAQIEMRRRAEADQTHAAKLRAAETGRSRRIRVTVANDDEGQ